MKLGCMVMMVGAGTAGCAADEELRTRNAATLYVEDLGDGPLEASGLECEDDDDGFIQAREDDGSWVRIENPDCFWIVPTWLWLDEPVVTSQYILPDAVATVELAMPPAFEITAPLDHEILPGRILTLRWEPSGSGVPMEGTLNVACSGDGGGDTAELELSTQPALQDDVGVLELDLDELGIAIVSAARTPSFHRAGADGSLRA